MTAAEQAAGRGRGERAWVAPPGRAVLASLVLRGLDPSHSLLPFAAAVAVCRAVDAVAGVHCRVKWPNDVWIGGRKTAGILIEGRPREGWAVLGVGLNVLTRDEEMPEDLRATATSLAAASGRPGLSVEGTLEALLAELGRALADGPAGVLAAWRERDALNGREISWDGGAGQARGIDDSGRLIVDGIAGTTALSAGEVRLVRPAGETP